jgi:hypothetical protein
LPRIAAIARTGLRPAVSTGPAQVVEKIVAPGACPDPLLAGAGSGRRQHDADVWRDRKLNRPRVGALTLERKRRFPELAVLGRPRLVVEVCEGPPSIVAGAQCERGPHEPTPAQPEPPAGQHQLIAAAGFEPLNLECDAPRTAFWLDSLRHHPLPTPYRRMDTHAGVTVQARPPDRCKLVPAAAV